jgi:hypothetical protein
VAGKFDLVKEKCFDLKIEREWVHVASTCLECTSGPVNAPPKPTCGSNTWLVKFLDTYMGYVTDWFVQSARETWCC